MNKKCIALASFCWLAAVGGCSAAETGSTPGDEMAEADATSVEAFATIDVGDQQVTFYGDDAGEILVGSAKSNFDPEFAIVQVERTAGTELTPLELFSALAPRETPPHQLVEDHAGRVLRLGRADASVLKVTYEPQLVEKAWTPGQCDTALGLTASSVLRKNSETVVDLCTSNLAQPCDVYPATGRHRAGVCNNSSSATMTTTAHTRHIDSGWRTVSATVAINGSYLWTSWPRLNKDLTAWIPSKLRLQAWAAGGSTLHARLAPN